MNALRGVSQQVLLHLRLNFRSRMAVLYQYLFPIIFLAAFRTVYRQEQIPLAQHLGELLTITILGSAAFGLPSGIVNDRERGIWRRYKMLPAPSFGILAGTLVCRYILLLTAGILQVLLCVAVGMPLPAHMFALWVAFTVSAFAFMAVGLDLSILAPTVPAVQALGQCIFLPMLVVGGVAFPLSKLPRWAQHVSLFLPGRYSVDAIQSGSTGNITALQFSVLALLAITLTGATAGFLAFRWDNRQRLSSWIAIAILGWVIVGFAAESHGVIGPTARPAAADLHSF